MLEISRSHWNNPKYLPSAANRLWFPRNAYKDPTTNPISDSEIELRTRFDWKMEKTMKIGKRFEGKVAIVTASTQGIGFGIAERLGLEGASVVVSSRKQVRGCTRSLSIFGCCFIFWCNYALVHLGFLFLIYVWLLWNLRTVNGIMLFRFWKNEVFISTKPNVGIIFTWTES